MTHEHYMSLALELAREAYDHGEVPVGAVVVGPDGEVLGRGRNRRQERGDATAHAELEAIREACARLGDWRLSGSCGSVIDLFYERYGHRPQVWAGVLEADCAALLRDFFRAKR